MKKLSSPPWLERLAARRVVVAVAVGVVCASLGVPHAWGDPLGLLLALAAATVIAGLTYQCLGLTGRVHKLMASNVELARTNATLNESVAASRAARQDLARQKMLAESLLAVARATGQRPVLEATLQNTLAISLALTGATHGSLFLFDANGRVARRSDPVKPAAVSVCSVHGGEAANVIPDSVELMGTCRSADEETRVHLLAELEKALGVARALGGDYEFQVMPGQASSHDTPAAVEWVRQAGIDLLGTEHVHAPKLGMGAEDFGCFVAQAREGGTMFGLGVWSGEGDKRRAHSPTFDIDECALPIGTAVMAEAAVRYLRGK